MCISLPGKTLEVKGSMALVDMGDRVEWFNALAHPEVEVNDYVLVHANLIVEIVSEEVALDMREAAKELQALMDFEDSGLQSEDLTIFRNSF